MRISTVIVWAAVAALAACGDDEGAATGGEICGNGADDDRDGFTDCADQDCWRAAACGEVREDDAETSVPTEVRGDSGNEVSPLPEVSETCDPCNDLGQLKGRVCSPSEHVYVAGARVLVEGVGCDGQAFTKEGTSGSDGTYWLLDVPCGTHTLTISKGSFEASGAVPIRGGEVTDVSGAATKVCFEAERTKIAVIDGTYDDLEGLVAQLGLSSDLYTDDGGASTAGTTVGLLQNPSALFEYDILFVNCGGTAGWMPQEHPEVMDNVKEFVLRGGSLYMSDYAWVFGEWSFPDAVEWVNDDDPRGMGKTNTSPQQIPSGTTSKATVVDGALAGYLGKSVIDIVFDQGPQIAPESIGPGTFAHVVGDIVVPFELNLKGAPLALSYVPAQGAGRVIYTNFHNDAQTTTDMLTILNYLVFTL